MENAMLGESREPKRWGATLEDFLEEVMLNLS